MSPFISTRRVCSAIWSSETRRGHPANWLLGDNGVAANIVNLAVNTGAPTITVNPLGGSAVATIDAVLTGSGGLTKDGTGTPF